MKHFAVIISLVIALGVITPVHAQEAYLTQMEGAASTLPPDLANRVEFLDGSYEPTASYCLSDAAYKAAKADRTAAVFALGSAEPTFGGRKYIDDALRTIPDDAVLVIEGHTDSVKHTGTEFDSEADLAYQLKLSEDRAATVAKIAQSKGFKIRATKGFGRTKPAVDFHPEHKGEDANRRVVIRVVDLPSCHPREIRLRVLTGPNWQGAPRGTAVLVEADTDRIVIGTTGTHYKPGDKEDTLTLEQWGDNSYLDFPSIRDTARIIAWKLPQEEWVFADEDLYICARESDVRDGECHLRIYDTPNRIVRDPRCDPCKDCP